MSCLFCKIASQEIPAAVVYEDDKTIAFQDLHPQAPTHVLIIPKKHISTLNDATEVDQALLGSLVFNAKKIANTLGLSEAGYRLIFNTNENGGQSVYHIHLHLLGGRPMTWPPG